MRGKLISRAIVPAIPCPSNNPCRIACAGRCDGPTKNDNAAQASVSRASRNVIQRVFIPIVIPGDRRQSRCDGRGGRGGVKPSGLERNIARFEFREGAAAPPGLRPPLAWRLRFHARRRIQPVHVGRDLSRDLRTLSVKTLTRYRFVHRGLPQTKGLSPSRIPARPRHPGTNWTTRAGGFLARGSIALPAFPVAQWHLCRTLSSGLTGGSPPTVAGAARASDPIPFAVA